jgi:hypothetical protein
VNARGDDDHGEFFQVPRRCANMRRSLFDAERW